MFAIVTFSYFICFIYSKLNHFLGVICLTWLVSASDLLQAVNFGLSLLIQYNNKFWSSFTSINMRMYQFTEMRDEGNLLFILVCVYCCSFTFHIFWPSAVFTHFPFLFSNYRFYSQGKRNADKDYPFKIHHCKILFSR